MFGNALCKIIVRDFLDLFIFYLVIGDGLLTVVFCDFFFVRHSFYILFGVNSVKMEYFSFLLYHSFNFSSDLQLIFVRIGNNLWRERLLTIGGSF